MNRRGFLIGATTLLVAPSIVRVSSLMPISVPKNNGLWLVNDGARFDYDQEHVDIPLGYSIVRTTMPYFSMDADFSTENLIIHMQRRITLVKESFREIYGTAGQ